jgi:hypothetical protein
MGPKTRAIIELVEADKNPPQKLKEALTALQAKYPQVKAKKQYESAPSTQPTPSGEPKTPEAAPLESAASYFRVKSLLKIASKFERKYF